jgi:molybdenum cofactor cytidylyltransferase
MSRSLGFGGVILAAGESSRMGTDKALLPWPPPVEGQTPSGDSFLSAAIFSLEVSTDFIVIVAGSNVATIAPVGYARGASIIVNPDPSQGQFSSLQVGLREVLNRGRDAAIVTLVDRPPASAATVQALRSAMETAPANIWAVVPEFRGKHGHPIVVSREMIERFLRAPATGNARDIEHQYQAHVQYFPVDDPAIAMNINTPEDYAALAAKPT